MVLYMTVRLHTESPRFRDPAAQSQLAMYAARSIKVYERQAEARMMAGKAQYPPVNSPEGTKGDARDKAGEAFGVSGETSGYLPRGKLDEACKRFGIAYDTAKQSVRVCGAIERCSRLHQLGFYHHMEVANRDDAAELLDWAVKNHATVKELPKNFFEFY
jgi:hypothetical protein